MTDTTPHRSDQLQRPRQIPGAYSQPKPERNYLNRRSGSPWPQEPTALERPQAPSLPPRESAQVQGTQEQRAQAALPLAETPQLPTCTGRQRGGVSAARVLLRCFALLRRCIAGKSTRSPLGPLASTSRFQPVLGNTANRLDHHPTHSLPCRASVAPALHGADDACSELELPPVGQGPRVTALAGGAQWRRSGKETARAGLLQSAHEGA